MAVLRTYQDRLGRFHDKLKSKMVDNMISLSGQAVDCLRMKVRYTRNGDIETREIVENDVVSVMVPSLQEIPMRVIKKEVGGQTFTINSLNMTETFPIEIYTTNGGVMTKGDLLVRVLRNDIDVGEPYVLVLEVKDTLGTFGASNLLWKKWTTTTYDETLPIEAINLIASMAERRLGIKW